LKRVYKWRGPGLGLEDITDRANRIPESVAPAVFGDIEPYEFMGESPYGKFDIVGSRSKHRELLKLGGYEEVGNEKPARLLEAQERERNG
jgi:hypothetical protein